MMDCGCSALNAEICDEIAYNIIYFGIPLARHHHRSDLLRESDALLQIARVINYCVFDDNT